MCPIHIYRGGQCDLPAKQAINELAEIGYSIQLIIE